MKSIMKIIYEGIMILLVMLTVVTIWTEKTYNSTVNLIVWIVFVLDFVVRLLVSKHKWQFLKENPFLIIAIIPFDQFFQMARIVRLFHLFRIKTIAKYYITPYVRRFSLQSITLIVTFFILFLLMESAMIWKVEASIQTFMESMFVVFGYLLFFGHNMYEIEYSLSVWLLTATSILGVVLQGIVLQWAFSRVEDIYKKIRSKQTTSKAS